MKSLVRLFICSAVLAGLSLTARSENPSKEALAQLHEFIGEWNGNGNPDGKKNAAGWKETFAWGWRFKGDDAWLTLSVTNGKYLKSGELRWIDDKKAYEFNATMKDGTKQTFEGTYKKDILTLERIDAKSNERQQFTMNTAAEGIRFLVKYRKASGGGKLFSSVYSIQANKEGESLAAKGSKNICVVSGGAGTTAVSFKGETFYVCCGGCKDAFAENPEKYVKEFKAKKAAN